MGEQRTDWDGRYWAMDVAYYERLLRLQKTKRSPSGEAFIREQIDRLRKRWPGKLEYEA